MSLTNAVRIYHGNKIGGDSTQSATMPLYSEVPVGTIVQMLVLLHRITLMDFSIRLRLMVGKMLMYKILTKCLLIRQYKHRMLL